MSPFCLSSFSFVILFNESLSFACSCRMVLISLQLCLSKKSPVVNWSVLIKINRLFIWIVFHQIIYSNINLNTLHNYPTRIICCYEPNKTFTTLIIGSILPIPFTTHTVYFLVLYSYEQ